VYFCVPGDQAIPEFASLERRWQEVSWHMNGEGHDSESYAGRYAPARAETPWLHIQA